MISILVPLSGRDIPRVQCNGYLLISIRAPLTGRDLGATFFEEVASSISIHTPLSGRDRLCADVRGEFGISIHAPLSGRDSVLHQFFRVDILFQSTLPSQGATTCTK